MLQFRTAKMIIGPFLCHQFFLVFLGQICIFICRDVIHHCNFYSFKKPIKKMWKYLAYKSILAIYNFKGQRFIFYNPWDKSCLNTLQDKNEFTCLNVSKMFKMLKEFNKLCLDLMESFWFRIYKLKKTLWITCYKPSSPNEIKSENIILTSIVITFNTNGTTYINMCVYKILLICA